MTRCARCCLHNSIRIVNVIILFFGVGMIIYALWLGEKWHEGTAELPYRSTPPRPWYTDFLSPIILPTKRTHVS